MINEILRNVLKKNKKNEILNVLKSNSSSCNFKVNFCGWYRNKLMIEIVYWVTRKILLSCCMKMDFSEIYLNNLMILIEDNLINVWCCGLVGFNSGRYIISIRN